ncbi:MAG: ribosome maturation factor RimM [Prevotella sp.]|nr:ribosome maturation factor RimM [Bacteroidales bacterium]MDY4956612.1 ribosome maturation factor RimM [Prevotella sp.]
MIRPDDIYKIGRLGKPHGVAGELTLMFSDDIFDRNDADFLFVEVDGIPVPFFIEEYRFRSNETCIIKFADIDNADQARRLVNCDVYFPKGEDDGDGELSLAALMGFSVEDSSTGTAVGRVVAVDTSTANTLLEVEAGSGQRLLIPLAPDLVEAIDHQAHTLRLRIPQGLLEL